MRKELKRPIIFLSIYLCKAIIVDQYSLISHFAKADSFSVYQIISMTLHTEVTLTLIDEHFDLVEH